MSPCTAEKSQMSYNSQTTKVICFYKKQLLRNFNKKLKFQTKINHAMPTAKNSKVATCIKIKSISQSSKWTKMVISF